MKKTLVALIVILLLCTASIPFISGMVMKKTVKASFTDLNHIYADQGSDISFSITDYNRGYASSQIEWKVDLGVLKTFYDIEDIVFVDRAKHSMTKVVSSTSLEKNPWFMDFINKHLDGNNPLEITTEYSISGQIKSQMSMKTFSFKNQENVINVLPANLSAQTQKGFSTFISSGSWQGLNAKNKLRVGPMSIDSKLSKVTSKIWQGNMAFSLNQLEVDDRGTPLNLSNLTGKYDINHDQENNSLSIGMTYAIDQIKIKKEDIKNAAIQINLNNLDADSYETFVTEYSKMINLTMRNLAQSPENKKERAKAFENQAKVAGMQMMGIYEKFLKENLELKISNLAVDLPMGNIRGMASLRLKKDMTFAQFVPVMMQPITLMDIFDFKSDVSLPAELVKANPKLMSPIYPGMQTGLFLVNDDKAIHKAETQDGKFILNSKEVILN